jgi:hypothetical protein
LLFNFALENHNLLIAIKGFENVAKVKFWEQQSQIKKLYSPEDVRADETRVMLATIVFRISCLSVFFLRTYRLKYTKHKILPLVLYGCENWSLTLREEHR